MRMTPLSGHKDLGEGRICDVGTLLDPTVSSCAKAGEGGHLR